MRPQIEVKRKSFETKFAFEWLFTRVDKLMPFQFRVIKKSFATAIYRTDVLALSVRHQVLSKRRGILEYFTAAENMTCVYL